MTYVPLWCRSNFSFLEGASHPDELVHEAARLGIQSVALTDRDGLYGIVRAHKAAKETGVRLIIGATVTIGDESARALEAGRALQVGRDTTELVLLSTDRSSYGRLSGLL
jgi:error-prone DNA polymerase